MIMKKRFLVLWILAGLAFWYSLIGFVLIPWILKQVVVPRLSERLNGSAEVAAVRINPWALSASLRGFRLLDATGAEVYGVERLDANFQISSAWQRQLNLSEVHIDNPRLHVDIAPDRVVNLQRMFAGFGGDAPAQTPEPAVSTRPIGVKIGVLEVADGSWRFTDRSLASPVDLHASPINYTVTGFHTDPDVRSPYSLSVRLADGASIQWEGVLSIFPLRSQARISITGLRPHVFLPYVEQLLNFEVRSAVAALSLEYDFDPLAAEPRFAFSNVNFELKDLALAARAAEATFFNLSSLRVEGVSVDIPAARLAADRVVIASDFLRAERLPDGSIDLIGHLLPVTAAAENASADAAPSGPDDPWRIPEEALQAALEQLRATLDSLWQIDVREISLRHQRVEFRDRAINPEAALALNDVAVDLSGFSNTAAEPFVLDAAFASQDGGSASLRLAMASSFDRGELEFNLDQFNLASLSPYAEALGGTLVRSGNLTTNVAITFQPSAGSGALDVRFDADVLLGALDTALADGGQPLFSAARVQVADIRSTLDLERLEIGAVEIDSPSVTLARDADGRMRLPGTGSPAPIPAAAEPHPEPQTDQTSLPFSLVLDSVKVRDGSFAFADASIDPSALIALQRITLDAGRLQLPSSEGVPFEFNATGRTGGTIRATGTFTPAAAQRGVETSLAIAGFSLPPQSTYAENFIGYAIESGALNLTSRIEISGTAFKTSSTVQLDGFDLSTEPSGKASLGVPIHLGIALLTDRNDRLEIRDIEVFGDFSDPQTKVSSLVVQAIVKIFTKVATAPFALLGSLLGADAKQLEQLAFAPASDAVDPAHAEQLRVLAEALHQRPQLTLVVVPGAAPDMDIAAWRARQLEAALARIAAEGKPSDLRKAARTVGADPDEPTLAALAALLIERVAEPVWRAAIAPEVAMAAAQGAVAASNVAATPAADADAADRRTLRRRGGRSYQTVVAPGEVPPDSVAVAPAPETPASPVGAATDQESSASTGDVLRALLLPTFNPSEDWLGELANRRAAAVRDYLVQTHSMDPERLVVDPPKIDLRESRIEFSLR